MRKIQRPNRRFHFSLVTFTVLACYVATMLLWPMDAVRATVTAQSKTQIGTAPALAWPNYGQSAIGTIDGGIIGTSGQQSSVPMASITKIITALTVLESKPLNAGQTGPTITFTPEDAARYNQYFVADGSIAKAEAGMQITEYQLLQGMLGFNKDKEFFELDEAEMASANKPVEVKF